MNIIEKFCLVLATTSLFVGNIGFEVNNLKAATELDPVEIVSTNNPSQLQAFNLVASSDLRGNKGWTKHKGWGTAIAVGTDGEPWVVNSKGDVWERYVHLQNAPKATDIAVDLDGIVWIVGPDYVSVKHPSKDQWSKFDVGGVAIAIAPDGNPWIVTASGQVLELKNGRFVQYENAPKASDIAIGPKLDYRAWKHLYQDTTHGSVE